MIVSSRSEPAGQHDAQDAQAQRNLVGDQLGARPQPAEEAVFVVAGPAAEDDAVDGDAAQGEDVDHADVDARRDDQLNRRARTPSTSNGGNTLPNGMTAKMAKRRGQDRRSAPA